MRSRRREITAAVVAAAGLALVGMGTAAAAPAAPPAAVAPAAAGAAARTMTVSIAAVPAKARATLAKAGVRAADFLVTEIRNEQSGRCLDAATQGLGQNGNKIQLWDCFGDPDLHGNQFWIPIFTTSGYTEIINWWSGLCLDADSSGGFVNGARVQEWGCFDDPVGHPNQWWNYGPVGSSSILPNLWGGAAKGLDASAQSIDRNGTAVLIWQFTGNPNQRWRQ
jgi:Ricin-type beta-trefoil lectin domain